MRTIFAIALALCLASCVMAFAPTSLPALRTVPRAQACSTGLRMSATEVSFEASGDPKFPPPLMFGVEYLGNLQRTHVWPARTSGLSLSFDLDPSCDVFGLTDGRGCTG
mmetsp:Transcript_64838/g.135180  ORF Transcript_64838/g.135180 Transcript_64838/m.135180 type:complete len:109 (+) Transcript_64838:126-452(+)